MCENKGVRVILIIGNKLCSQCQDSLDLTIHQRVSTGNLVQLRVMETTFATVSPLVVSFCIFLCGVLFFYFLYSKRNSSRQKKKTTMKKARISLLL